METAIRLDTSDIDFKGAGEALVAIATCDASDQVKLAALETYGRVASITDTTISHNVFNSRRTSD